MTLPSASSFRAAVIEPVGGHGGMNYYDAGLCGGLAKADVEVTLHTCDINPPDGSAALFNVRPTFSGVYGSAPKWLRAFRYVGSLVRCLVFERMHKTRVAHFHFFHVGVLEYLGVWLARSLGMAVVITAHDVEALKQGLSIKPLVRLAYGQAAAIIAHNATSAAELQTKFALPASLIWTIPHGNYLDFIAGRPSRESARRQLGVEPDDRAVILFFGQIKEVKGLDLLIRAFAKMRGSSTNSRLSHARLIIAGRPWKDDFSRYQRLIDTLGVADSVTLHLNYIADADVANYYGAADVVVLPYRKIYQSGVLLMAMSYGVPVVASDLSAMCDVIQHRVNGVLFPSDDADALASALTDVLSDAALLDSVGTSALETMRLDFGWNKIGRQTAQAYRAIGSKT